MVKMSTWQTKLSRSFSGFCGWRQTRPRNQVGKKFAVEPVVVTVRKIVDVILQVGRAYAVMRAVNAPLQLAPKSVNRVRVASPANVFLSSVVDDLMLESQRRDVIINRQFVRVDRRPGFNRLADVADTIGGRHPVNHFGADTASPIRDADDRCLASGPATTLAGTDAADVGFVGLAFAGEKVPAAGHKLSDFMPHAVRALVSHAELPREFFSRDSVFALGKKENGKEPRFQRRFGFVENRVGSRMQLRTAKRASVATPGLDAVKAIRFSAFADVAREPGAEDEIQTCRSRQGTARQSPFEVYTSSASYFDVFVQMFKNPRCQLARLRGPHVSILPGHRHPQLDLTSCGDAVLRWLTALGLIGVHVRK